MITERSIINFLLWTGGLVLGCYLATTTAYQNYYPLLFTVGTVFLVFTFVVVRDRMCLFPLLGSFVGGKFNFLPFGLAAGDIGTVLLILYFMVTYIALQQRPIKTGPLYFFLPVLIIFSIIFYHDHSFGLKAFGGTMEGSRPGVLILLTSIAYVCGINMPSPPALFLKNVPWFCFAIATISSIPYIISTYVPSLTPYLFVVTNNVNADAYLDATTYSQYADSSEIGRNNGQAAIGGTLVLCLICYYPITTWWQPRRWFIGLLGLICCALVLSSGFRNNFVSFGLTVFLGIWCHYPWRSLIIIPALVIALMALSLSQQYHILNLPLPIQRSLSFLPGSWDESVLSSTDSSNEFREEIERVYIQEYLYKSPWFGNGLTWDAAKYDELDYLAKTQETADHYYRSEFFITGKMFHTGWLSLYDIVGLVGSAAFIFLNLSMIWVSGRMVVDKNVDRTSPLFPLKVWTFIGCVTGMFGFFALFGDFKSAFPGLCYFMILLFHLIRLDEQARREAGVPSPHQTFQMMGPKASMLGLGQP
ncbi:MAG: hypothetical protein LV479_06545 [Methylacidiphilales bacterium]|nr:hypothetical protein [Candidatus Methylacidiphilales bacterium]